MFTLARAPTAPRAHSRRSGLVRDESGQSTVEYILLLAFAMLIAVGMFSALNEGLNEGVLAFGAALERDLQTGGMPAGAWAEAL
ncbi:MAG: hypothetical protein IT285_08360 [Bdellovibrionales bacterium]|nr:hypothetical protein [Bdellovibrionales bacterium]